MRPAHWLKNLFVLAPLFFADSTGIRLTILAFVGFISFSLLSSVIYIFNDWRDVEADRLHKKKKLRPLASGAISTRTAFLVAVSLLFSMGLLLVNFNFKVLSLFPLVVYGIINLSYSLGFKQIPVLELVLVSSGFVIRVIYGALIIDVELSIWILVCTGLLSTLIVIGKRRGDLIQGNDEQLKRLSLKGYNLIYLNHLTVIFSSCVITSYLLFCASSYATVKFGSDVLLTSIFVIFGILIYLKLLMVDEKGDDPVNLFLSSSIIQCTAFGWIISFLLVKNF